MNRVEEWIGGRFPAPALIAGGDVPVRPELSLWLGLQDERAVAVAAAHPLHSPGRRQQPAAVVRRPQERGEGRIRVEARETEPIDRPVLGDEREAAEVSDDGVVLDARGHPTNLSGRLAARTWERFPGWTLQPGSAGFTLVARTKRAHASGSVVKTVRPSSL